MTNFTLVPRVTRKQRVRQVEPSCAVLTSPRVCVQRPLRPATATWWPEQQTSFPQSGGQSPRPGVGAALPRDAPGRLLPVSAAPVTPPSLVCGRALQSLPCRRGAALCFSVCTFFLQVTSPRTQGPQIQDVLLSRTLTNYTCRDRPSK